MFIQYFYNYRNQCMFSHCCIFFVSFSPKLFMHVPHRCRNTNNLFDNYTPLVSAFFLSLMYASRFYELCILPGGKDSSDWSSNSGCKEAYDWSAASSSSSSPEHTQTKSARRSIHSFIKWPWGQSRRSLKLVCLDYHINNLA